MADNDKKTNPTLVQALKREVLKQIKANIKDQYPALSDPKAYMDSVRDRFIQNVGGSVTLNALRKAGIINVTKRDKRKEDTLRQNEQALSDIRKELRSVRSLLQQNQSIIKSLASSKQQPQQPRRVEGQPTFSPSAIQQTIPRVGGVGGRRLFGPGAAQYRTPAGEPIAARVEQQGAGGGSGFGLGALAAAATAGAGFLFGGRRRGLAAGARALQSIGVPRIARGLVMRGAAGTARRYGARAVRGAGAAIGRAAAFGGRAAAGLLSGKALAIGAIGALLLPKEVKTIIEDSVKGAFRSIGLDESFIDTILSPFRFISGLLERLKGFISKGVKGVTGTEGVPGSSMESETGAPPPYEAPSAQQTPSTQQPAPSKPTPSLTEAPGGSTSGKEIGPSPAYEAPAPTQPAKGSESGDYTEAKKALAEESKNVDEKVKVYDRLIKENQFPPSATEEDKKQFAELVEGYKQRQLQIKQQLNKPANEINDYDKEKQIIVNLTESAKKDTNKLREAYKKLGGAPAVRVPSEEAPTDMQPPATRVPSEGATEEPQPDGVRVPSEEATKDMGPPASRVPSEQTQAPLEQPTYQKSLPFGTDADAAQRDMQQTQPISPVNIEPSIGTTLSDRSMKIAQQRSMPRQPSVSTNVIDNSQKTNPQADDAETFYIPSPVASRADLDGDIIFSPVA